MARPKRYETVADKQKAYRERKKNSGVRVERLESMAGSTPAAPALDRRSKIEELRELVRAEQEKPTTEARVRSDVVGGIYRNDFGAVISKMAYEKLQEKKRQAKDGGYTLDEYSQ